MLVNMCILDIQNESSLSLSLSSLRRRGPPKESSETKSEAGSGEAMTTKAGAGKDMGEGEGEDLDYHASESEGEDESTIAEQEAHEGAIDYHCEVSTLEKEGMPLPCLKSSLSEATKYTITYYTPTCTMYLGELSLEELLKLYNLQRHSATPETNTEGTSVDEEEQTPGGCVGELTHQHQLCTTLKLKLKVFR